MRLVHALLILLFAALQGVAPLLHAHLQEGPYNGSGVHLVGIGELPSSTASDGPVANGTETRALEMSEPFRRVRSGLPDIAAIAVPPWRGPPAPAAATPWSHPPFRPARPVAGRLPPPRGPPSVSA